MNYNVTPGGIELLQRVLAGECTVNFREIHLGNGADAGDSPTHLNNDMMQVGINDITREDLFVALSTAFDNGTVLTAFQITEWGIMADDPDHENSLLLFAYYHVPAGQADFMPASAEFTKEFDLTHRIYVGEAESVTATISESTIWASKAAFDAHVADQNNPHGVTKAQIGLGDVENKSTNDQTPTYTEASALTTITSGERLAVAFGKIKKAISTLINHINSTGNVHSVTAAQIGAAAASHTHGAGDINSGILSVERGGTGNSTGRSPTATKLATARTIRVNLASESAQEFDGSSNVTPGVNGILPVSHGGTGVSDLSQLGISGKRFANIVVGSSAAGWTAADVDYLCDGTDDQVEINAALSAVPSGGGRVLLLSGTYNCTANVTIAKAYTELCGVTGAKLNFTVGEKYVYCAKDHCVIRGITATGIKYSDPWEYGLEEDLHPTIYLSSADRCIVTGCHIVRGEIFLNTCTNCIVSNNVMGQSNAFVDSIELKNGTGNTVVGNNLSGGFYAIILYNEKKVNVVGNTCTLHNEWSIYVTGCAGVNFTGNHISTTGGGELTGGKLINSRNIVLTGNYFANTGSGDGTPFQISSCYNIVMVGNTIITDHTATPISVSNCTKGIYRMNNIIGASGISTGFSLSNNSDVTASDNLVSTYTSSDA